MTLHACAADSNADTPSGSGDVEVAAGATVGPDATELLRSAVGVRAGGCSLVETIGTGAVVADQGTVVTVAHTLAGADTVVVIDADGTEHAATVTSFDPGADLAALSVPTLDAPPLALGTDRVGPARALRWRPDSGIELLEVDITRRLAITIEDIYLEREVRRSGMELAAEIEVGDSGGPVIDDAGRVVGIVYANSRSRPRVGFATDATEIDAVLAAGRPGVAASTQRCR